MKRLIDQWKAVLLVLLLLGLIIMSFSHMMGGFHSFLLAEHMDYWSGQKKDPSGEDLLKMDTLYNQASNHLLYDPELLQFGGHLSEWQAYTSDGEVKRKFFSEALVRYRESIDENPMWPYVRFDLAKAKIRASEIDAEFQNALRETMRLGPNERSLQVGVVQLGLLTWHLLDDSTREIVLMAVNKVLKRNPKDLYRASKDYKRVELLCSLVHDNDWINKACLTELE